MPLNQCVTCVKWQGPVSQIHCRIDQKAIYINRVPSNGSKAMTLIAECLQATAAGRNVATDTLVDSKRDGKFESKRWRTREYGFRYASHSWWVIIITLYQLGIAINLMYLCYVMKLEKNEASMPPQHPHIHASHSNQRGLCQRYRWAGMASSVGMPLWSFLHQRSTHSFHSCECGDPVTRVHPPYNPWLHLQQ